jgi:hypothetical protein
MTEDFGNDRWCTMHLGIKEHGWKTNDIFAFLLKQGYEKDLSTLHYNLRKNIATVHVLPP